MRRDETRRDKTSRVEVRRKDVRLVRRDGGETVESGSGERVEVEGNDANEHEGEVPRTSRVLAIVEQLQQNERRSRTETRRCNAHSETFFSPLEVVRGRSTGSALIAFPASTRNPSCFRCG
ncbi:unnamed protein product, partial [Heterotrigona itama]